MIEYGFVFQSENCVQCHACEVACKTWRKLAPGVKWRRVYNIWHGCYPDISSSTLSVSCMHCVEPACMAVCPVDAIRKREKDGVVLVDAELCIGCRQCYTACPVGAPQFGLDGVMQKCDFCTSGPQADGGMPVCVLACPTRALAREQMSVEQKAMAEISIKSILSTE